MLPEDVAEVVSMWTGIPLVQIASEESERLLHMEDDLRKRIVGQDEPIQALAKAVRRSRAGLKDPRRPIGVSCSSAPTGVGKTELARAWPSSCSGPTTTWSAWTCPSSWSGTPSPGWSARLPDTSATTTAAS